MTLAEILLGKPDADFAGLVPLIHLYLDFIRCDAATRAVVQDYMTLVVGRATGDVQAGASWQRGLVRAHPEYRGDSVVPPAVAADLLRAVHEVASGRRAAPELLGRHAPPHIAVTDADLAPLAPGAQPPGDGGESVVLHLLPSEFSASASSSAAAAAAGAGAGASVAASARATLVHASAVVAAAAAAPAGHGAPPAPAAMPAPAGSAMPPLALASSATATAGSMHAHAAEDARSTRLRGSSFEGSMVYECGALRRIVERYETMYGLTHRGARDTAPDSPYIRGSA